MASPRQGARAATAAAKTHPSTSWKDWLKTADAWNAVGTIFLVVVGIWGIIETKRSLQLSERAWIGIGPAVFIVNPVDGQPIRYAYQFTNPGKEPALDLSYASDSGVVSTPPSGDMASLTVRDNETCKELMPVRGGGVIVPGGVGQRNIDTGRGVHPAIVDKDFLGGRNLIYAHGCVAYRTFNKVHHTSYCMIFSAQPSPPSLPAQTMPMVGRKGAGEGVSNEQGGALISSPVPSVPVAATNCPTGSTAD